jgi:hypothetical protein
MPAQPSWWQKLKNKLSQLGTPAGLGGGLQVPKIPTTTTTTKPPKPWWQQLGNIPVGGTPSPLQSTSLPAWLQPKPPANTGYQTFAPADKYNAAPAQPLPTSSFIGGGGNAVLGANQQAVSPIIPTSSVIGGGGQYVLGPNQKGYLRDRPIGSTTFLGAGGEAVRGPDVPIATVPASGSGSSGGGGGYGYKKKRYGGGRGYTPRTYAPSQYQDNAPAWAKSAGLANWSIG